MNEQSTMPRGGRGGRGGGAAAAAAATAAPAEPEETITGLDEEQEAAVLIPAAQVLLRIPIALRVLAYSAKNLRRMVDLSRVNSAWTETAQDYGCFITERIFLQEEKSRTKNALLQRMFWSVIRLPSYPWIFCHLVQIWAHLGHPAHAIVKHIQHVSGGPSILHALCYRHKELTTGQAANRLLQLRYLFQRCPDIDTNGVTQRTVPVIEDERLFIDRWRAKLVYTSVLSHRVFHRVLYAAPWSSDRKLSALHFAIDGRASYDFLMELLKARSARHAALLRHGSPLTALQMAARAANPVAMRALVDSGVAAKLVSFENKARTEESALMTAVGRMMFGFPLFVIFPTLAFPVSAPRFIGFLQGPVYNHHELRDAQLLVKEATPQSNAECVITLLQLAELYRRQAPEVLDHSTRFFFDLKSRAIDLKQLWVRVPVLVLENAARGEKLTNWLTHRPYSLPNFDSRMAVIDRFLSVSADHDKTLCPSGIDVNVEQLAEWRLKKKKELETD